jgi:hypothetical protein
METANSYPDALWRDMADSWVTIQAATLQPPAGVTLRSQWLLGYLYVDHHTGFRLRIQGSLFRTPNCKKQACQPVEWEIGYDDIKALSLCTVTAEERAELCLYTPPPGLHVYETDFSYLRRLRALDGFRALGHPDHVRVWRAANGTLFGEQVWVRLEREAFPSVFDCTLLDQSESGVMPAVQVVEFDVDGRRGLFCVQPQKLARGGGKPQAFSSG